MEFERTKPYNSLPLLPPKADLESKLILKKLITAREALAKLDAGNRRLPNEHLMVNSVILQEAKLSSEVESIVTTNDELYEALAAEKKDIGPETKEVLRYPEALWHGFEFVKKNGFMNTNLYIEMDKIIIEQRSGIRKVPGTQLVNPTTKQIYYTPPEGESVIRGLLKNFDDYINDDKDGIDPLVKMAVAHYQFESIHPFHDGNGRTGRIINILFLTMRGLLRRPVLYLSKYVIENKVDYYKNLRLITEDENWEPWIMYMLNAVDETARYTDDKINRICELMAATGDIIKDQAAGIYSKELVEVLFRLPYIKRKFLVEAGMVKPKTAGKYLSELERIGILRAEKVGREKLYINKKFFNLLKT